jgi:hypothetical protein
MATRNIVPRSNGEGSIGTAVKHWGNGYFDELNTEKLVVDDIIAKGPVVDVRAFGAVGDGVHDDTAAIQAAIDSGGKTIYFPSGTYIVTDTLKIKNYYVTFTTLSTNEYKTNIKLSSSIDAINEMNLIEVVGGFVAENIIFEGSSFASSGDIKTYSKVNGVVIKNDSGSANIDSKFINCSFMYFRTAVECYGRNVDFINSLFSLVHCGIEQKKVADDNEEIRGLRVIGCRFHACVSQYTIGYCIKVCLEAFNIQIINNFVDGMSRNFYQGPLNETTLSLNHIVQVNPITAIHGYATVENCASKISENIISGPLDTSTAIANASVMQRGIAVNPHGNVATIKDVKISNNIIKNAAGSSIDINGDIESVEITGNQIINTGYRLRDYNGGVSGPGVLIAGNVKKCILTNNIINSLSTDNTYSITYGIRATKADGKSYNVVGGNMSNAVYGETSGVKNTLNRVCIVQAKTQTTQVTIPNNGYANVSCTFVDAPLSEKPQFVIPLTYASTVFPMNVGSEITVNGFNSRFTNVSGSSVTITEMTIPVLCLFN